MADSTPTLAPRTAALAAWTAVLLITGAVALAGAPPARADGDPASDVLAAQPLFLPADGGFSQAGQAQLTAVLDEAQRSGDPIRLALIATPSDLGSVSALWGNPRGYAQFLGTELSLVYRGTLLVVMPAGFGVAEVGGPAGSSSAAAQAAASLKTPPRGTPMVAAALAAVRTLAARAGHPVPLPTAAALGAATGSGSWLGSVDIGSWLALGGGAVLIAVAWAASLRAAPVRRQRTGRAG